MINAIVKVAFFQERSVHNVEQPFLRDKRDKADTPDWR